MPAFVELYAARALEGRDTDGARVSCECELRGSRKARVGCEVGGEDVWRGVGKSVYVFSKAFCLSFLD